MISAREALERLREGNGRFATGRDSRLVPPDETRRRALLAGQQPFAAVVGCADSRAPVEILFDQGPGNLFVVRVAGNLVTPEVAGSIEYAVQQLATPLVVVLGHTRCGAVQTTLDELTRPTAGLSPNLGALVAGVRPAVEPLLEEEPRPDPEVLTARAVRANIRASVAGLGRESAVLAGKVRQGELVIVGAEYDLATGTVDFFTETPAGD